MKPFSELSRQDKATAVAQRFVISRNLVLTATIDSCEAAWNANDPKLLVNSMDQPILGGSQAPSISKETLIKIINEVVDPKLALLKPELLSRKLEIKTPKDNGFKKVGAQHKHFPELMAFVSLKLNVWLAGDAGSGKTHAAAQIAAILERQFLRVSCGPQTPASIIFGHTTANGGYAPGIAYQALTVDPAVGSVLLFDEFDRMNPAVAVMVNGLLDGGAVTFPNGETLKPHDNVTYLVAANTFGKPTAEFGTAQRQDAATMSRFVKLHWPVDEQLEREVFGANEWVSYVQKVRKVVKDLGVTSLVVTPRASEYGVKMLTNGINRQMVEDTLLWNGIGEEDKKKIHNALKGVR